MVTRKIFFRITAVFLGFLSGVSLLAILELFFRAYPDISHHHQLFPYDYSWKDGTYDLSGIDLSYVRDLKPYPMPYDWDDPDDYENLFSLDECPERRFSLKPIWYTKPNCRGHVVLHKLHSRRVVYDAHYSFDQNGFRVIPAADPNAKNTLFFMGCSFTFGEGVDDEDSFANLVTQGLGPVNAMNISLPGYGPNDLLFLLEQSPSDPRLQAMRGHSGTVVYSYIAKHMQRVIGSLEWLRDEQGSLSEPKYELRNGSATYTGPFESSPESRLLALLGKSELLRYINRDIPRVGDDQIRLFVAVLTRIKNIMAKDYGAQRFVVVFLPEERLYTEKLRPLLEKEGMIVLDLSGVPARKLTQGRYVFQANGHPSKIGHRLIAELILSELKKCGFRLNPELRSP